MSIWDKVHFTKPTADADAVDYSTGLIKPKYTTPWSAENNNARIYLPSALITAMKKAKGNARILDSLAGLDDNKLGYMDFNLETVGESFDERFQITETFGDQYAVFGIGKKPKFLSFSGSLINAKGIYDWRIKFIHLFEEYLSISRLARFSGVQDNKVTIAYDSILATGAMLTLRTSINAANELATPFSFNFLATSYRTTNQELAWRQEARAATPVKSSQLASQKPVKSTPKEAVAATSSSNTNLLAKE